jgi:hypothetical protein
MKVHIDVEERGSIVRSVDYEVSAADSVESVAKRLAQELGVDTDEVLADLGTNGVRFEKDKLVDECLAHGHRWRHRRVCIELHFESEQSVHHFPAGAHWRRVHRWGCKKFEVANDACVNLELREGSETGPALNEKAEIGVFPGCKTVWLVKPGPEPNG